MVRGPAEAAGGYEIAATPRCRPSASPAVSARRCTPLMSVAVLQDDPMAFRKWASVTDYYSAYETNVAIPILVGKEHVIRRSFC